jgi:hypothetical protein
MDHEMVEPFDTDDLPPEPEYAFAMGVEWAAFRQRLLAGHTFEDLVLDANADRLCAMAVRHNRYAEIQPAGEGWARIFVTLPLGGGSGSDGGDTKGGA